MSSALRVLIVAEHASARFGGEAALPLHYFRVLRNRCVPVWLVSHARTRGELSELYPGDDAITYIEDTLWHKALWWLGRRMPDPIAYFTTGFLSRLTTQFAQRRVVRRLVRQHGISVVHQPMPVSPREPSLMHGVGAPVVIGPMNGGMDFPPAFRRHRGAFEAALIASARLSSGMLNVLMPGKRRAALLVVANQRTRLALPAVSTPHVVSLVENGVDLSLWRLQAQKAKPESPVTFAFMGRLVAWKGVDLLLRAFAQARKGAAIRLWILGDGEEKQKLEALASELGLPSDATAAGSVHFAGWLRQAQCAERLQQADVLVLPSLLECGGAVVLEAMSLGKPVIATAWGGPLDYLDATCGILVEPNSASGLIAGFAKAMSELASNAAKRDRLGACGLAKVRAEYDWEHKVDRMVHLYEQLVRSVAIA